MENDSPNGLFIDSLCLMVGAIAGALINQCIYMNCIPKFFDYLNGLIFFGMLVVLVIFAIRKIKGIAHESRHYMFAMVLLGWFVGTYVVVEFNKR
jgi:hypothetical protein